MPERARIGLASLKTTVGGDTVTHELRLWDKLGAIFKLLDYLMGAGSADHPTDQLPRPQLNVESEMSRHERSPPVLSDYVTSSVRCSLLQRYLALASQVDD